METTPPDPPRPDTGPRDDGAETLSRVGADAAADAGGLDPDLLGDFLAGLTQAVAGGSRLPKRVLQDCRDAGQRAARAGVALPALLDLYLSAGWRLWRRLPAVRTAAVHPSAHPQEVIAAAEVMLRAVDDGVAALADGYQLARRGLVRQQESARREFIDDLLGGGADVAGLIERAGGFGLDLSGPHAVVVVTADRPFLDGTATMGAVERAIHAAGGAGTAALVASKDSQLVVVLAAAAARAVEQAIAALAAVLNRSATTAQRRAASGAWRAGIGRARPGPSGVLSSYQEARSALELAAKLDLPGQVLHAADLLIYQVLMRERAAVSDLVATVLGPLDAARGGARPLLDTLNAYFDAGGNTAGASRALFLSVRAVTYRLDRIRRLTGHDPASRASRFTLHAAVLGAKLLDWPATPLPAELPA